MPPAFRFAGAEVLPGSGLGNRSLLRFSRSTPAGACPACGRSIELFDVIGAQFLHLAVADIGDDRLPQKSSRVNKKFRECVTFGSLQEKSRETLAKRERVG